MHVPERNEPKRNPEFCQNPDSDNTTGSLSGESGVEEALDPPGPGAANNAE
jgi:hypothetical protein